ncbi:alpha/beta fold hydrolase [Actinomycetospora chiangmaiensis]|uniref:alpha/beta fold hydrolase n=1 Tax=Actinomycetospora chiangmaiensis TaxID=402650 RepID=UPI00036AEADB|nr:alpha/beta fold hydrolase [Actinomycetospora chiangmaiensis]
MAKPVLLVHGAFLGAWAWQEVIEALEAQGVEASAVDLTCRTPEGSLAGDATLVRGALASLGQPAVLVGQSYGGMVITEASAGNDDVAHLVYVCAALPVEGEHVGSLLATDPHPTTLGEGIRMIGEGPMATLDPETARSVPGHDVPEAVMDEKLPLTGEHNMAVFEQEATGFGWREHPSTYVVTTQDTVFSPDLQRTMAARATRSVDIATSHFPMFSRPAELAAIIAEAAAD